MTKIINGKKIANNLSAKLAMQIKDLERQGIAPRLAIVAYHADERSKTYINLKRSRATEIGIATQLEDYSDLTQKECMHAMQELVKNPAVHGIIVQLPLTGWHNPQSLLDLIPPGKDVDGLSTRSLDDLKNNQAKLIPATPKAILTALAESGVELKGQKNVIVGQGKLVGYPLSIIMKNKGLDVEVADINTKNLGSLTKQADILISAVGKPHLITGNMVQPNTVVIDAGIVEVNGRLAGDVDYNSVDKTAGMVAKVPGGIGPITVVSLLQNTIIAAKNG